MIGPKGVLEQLKRLLNYHQKTLSAADFLAILSPFVSKEMDLRREKTWLRDKEDDPRRLYYFSAEYLTGRLLRQNLISLDLLEDVRELAAEHGLDLTEILEQEYDPGLGNGGLGRLASCFMDSLVNMDLPATGYGICYRYGLFRQRIENFRQVEHTDNWRDGDLWGTEDKNSCYTIPYGGSVNITVDDAGELRFRLQPESEVWAIPVDYPVGAVNSSRVHPLRLWRAESPVGFRLDRFNSEEHVSAFREINEAESLTAVLYPGDRGEEGKLLRLKQQYFFVSASLQDILHDFRESRGGDWDSLPEKVVIQLNDTHPVLAIPELMRLLLDEELLSWDKAWEICRRVFAYTNHTVLEEALERWPVRYIRRLFPRLIMIIEEIQRRLEEEHPGSPRIIRDDCVHMAALAVHGSFSVNGVAALHSRLLKETVLKEWHALYPERFNNKTNGITHRRWLMECNPGLSMLIDELIGRGWRKEPERLRELERYGADSAVLDRLEGLKRQNKREFSRWLKQSKGIIAEEAGIYDFHVKRLHEYKRQLLNIFSIIRRYLNLTGGLYPEAPHVFFMGGKAAPGYYMAKEIIYLAARTAETINSDPRCRGRLQFVFLPGYTVSMAEKIFPAAELSQQISTAGKEASGTGNMKFMMNGALTLGTRDGANIEIFEKAGEENNIPFGLNAEEVVRHKEGYNPRNFLGETEGIKKLFLEIDRGLLGDPSGFRPLLDHLLNEDPYLVLPEIGSHSAALNRAERLYGDREEWNRKSLYNIAGSGYFSSDRTIDEYVKGIWKISARKA